MVLLHLRVTQKAVFCCFSISFYFSSLFLDELAKGFLGTFHQSLPRTRVIGIEVLLLDSKANIFVKTIFIVKFRRCKHYMTCALKKITMLEISKHMDLCSSTAKNIMSLVTTRPMTTKLGRVVTCHERLSPKNSHDSSIMWSCRSRGKLNALIFNLH